MVHLAPTANTLTAEGFTQLMQDHIFSKHGLPLDIIHDRDPRFNGHFFREVSRLLGLHQSNTTAFHPQSDGQTERMNRTIEQVLRAHSATTTEEWDTSLSMVEFAMNNSVHASTKHTPFFLNTGLNPITPIVLAVMQADKSRCLAAYSYALSRQQALKDAMEHLKLARDRYKSYADSNRKDILFHVGDDVLLSTQNINKHHQSRKLYPKFVGPFKVTAQVNDVAYRLELPPSMPINDVFHVCLLKPYQKGTTPTPPPIPIVVEGEYEYEVERILIHRDRRQGKRCKREYYVKWLGYGPEHCTWESEKNLTHAPECTVDYWSHNARLQEAAAIRLACKRKA
jgi:hypothetical protein